MRRVARSEYSLIRLRICPSVCLKHDPDQTEKDMGKEIPRVSLSNKQKKIKYSMGKCIYQILGLYRFFVCSGVGYNTQTDEYATEFRNIGYGLLASREFKSIM